MSSIIIRKHMKNLQTKTTKPDCWSKKRGDLNTKYGIKVEIEWPKKYRKIVLWNFHVYDFQGNNKYNI